MASCILVNSECPWDLTDLLLHTRIECSSNKNILHISYPRNNLCPKFSSLLQNRSPKPTFFIPLPNKRLTFLSDLVPNFFKKHLKNTSTCSNLIQLCCIKTFLHFLPLSYNILYPSVMSWPTKSRLQILSDREYIFYLSVKHHLHLWHCRDNYHHPQNAHLIKLK